MNFLDDSMKQLLLPGTENMQPKAIAPKPVKKDRPMTTGETLRSGQLPMFLTAKEIKDNYYPLPGDFISATETREDLWKRKAQESREGSPGDARKKTTKETLADSIAREGVRNPVTLGMEPNRGMGADKPFVYGGHHRVATAAQINPNMLVPVTNAEGRFDSTTGRKQDQREGNPFNIGSGERLNY